MNTSPSLSAVSSHRNGSCGNSCSSAARPVPTSTSSDPVGDRWAARLGQDAAHDLEPIGAAVVGDPRLGRIFGRKGRQRLGADVGRIGDNEVVALAGVGGEQIGAQQRNALLQSIVAHIALGDGERILRDVARIDRRIRERQGRQNGQATRPRAKIQDRADGQRIKSQRPLVAGRSHVLAQQFADIGARHNGSLVDKEGVPLDPGLLRDIGGRLARGDAHFDGLAQGLALLRQQAGVEPGVELVDSAGAGYGE